MAASPDLSVVVAVYDEEENLPRLHDGLAAALDAAPWSWEVIYVDDGSRDGSSQILRELAEKDDHARFLRFDENHGQSAAWAAGFRGARGRWVATLDADLQNDPADLPTMVERLSDEADPVDVVCGIRTGRQDSLWRKIQSRIGNGFRNLMTGKTVRDAGCSLRVMRREFLDSLEVFDGMHRFLPTLLHWDGAKIVEIPVRHHPRAGGASKYGMRNRAVRGLLDVMAMRWLRKRRVRYRIVEES